MTTVCGGTVGGAKKVKHFYSQSTMTNRGGQFPDPKPLGGLKHFYSQLTSPWVPMLLLIQKYMKNSPSHKGSQLSQRTKAKT